jgi:hypothetical protein
MVATNHISVVLLATYTFPVCCTTAGKSRFGSLLSGGHYSGKTDRIYMKGPGGRGEVEVAVSGVAGMQIFHSTIFEFCIEN